MVKGSGCAVVPQKQVPLGAEDTHLESSSLLKSGNKSLKDLETGGCKV